MELNLHPSDTVETLETLKNRGVIAENLWYHLNYQQVKYNKSRQEYVMDKLSLKKRIQMTAEMKTLWMETMAQRRQAILTQMDAHVVRILSGKTSGRLVHGLGGGHVRETNITLHPLYGIPYIPASSIKGVLRHWIMQAFFQGDQQKFEQVEKEGSDEQREVAKVVHALFGTAKNRGRLVLYDAYIRDVDFHLQPDVMTIHFPNYYQEGTPPTDDQSPVPISFYTIENAVFEWPLILLKRRSAVEGHESPDDEMVFTDEDLMALAVSWLSNALTEQGIGAKTTIGYGYFDQLEDQTEKLLDDFKKERELRLQNEKERFEQLCQEKQAEKLEQMDPHDSLVYEIEHLSNSPEDVQRSKSKFNDQVISFAQEQRLAPAKALRQYWESIGEWNGKLSDKQKKKVQELKRYLKDER